MRTNKLYQKATAIICIVLVFCIGFLMPLHVYGESTNVKYLCDVKLCYAKSASDAKSKLEAEGYTFQNNNLNNGTDRDKGVWLGYKTTTNKELAITDIRALGMDSGYQLYDYKGIVDYLTKSQSDTALAFYAATNEFIQNYENGSPKAESAYLGLNVFYVDEAEMKLGDYLLSGEADNEFFMKVIINSSATAVNTLITCLNAAVAPYENDVDEDGETISVNWGQMVSQSPVFDMLDGNPTTAQLNRLKKMYHDHAVMLFKQMQDFVTKYENALARHPDGEVKIDTSADTPEEIFEEAEDTTDEDADVLFIEAFNKLNEFYYNEDEGIRLGDWILETGHSTSETIDLTTIYPLAEAMGTAQCEMIGKTDLLSAVSNLGENERMTDFEEQLDGAREKIADYNGKDYVSLWENSDGDIKNSKIAFTSSAIRQATANDLIIKSQETQNTAKENFELVMKWIGWSVGILSAVVFVALTVCKVVAWVATSAALSSFMVSAISVLSIAGAVCFVAGILIAAATLIAWLYFLFHEEDEEIVHSQTPGYVIDATDSKDGTVIVRYKTVLCNEQFDSDTDRTYHGDLNARQEDKWTIIAYTQDIRVGSPIREDEANCVFKVVQGNSSTPNGYAPLRPFGDRNAVNCNNYCEDDDVDGIFVFYRTEKSIKNETPATDENTPESSDTGAVDGYLATLNVVTAKNSDLAKAKINKGETKYYILDQNLSPDAGYATYLSYKITMDPKKAITDIRIAPYNGNNSVTYGDITYLYGGTVGVNTGAGESTASSPNDAILFTTDEKAGSPISVNSLFITRNQQDAQPGWEPVTTFSGMPYDLNVTHIQFRDNPDISGYTQEVKDGKSMTYAEHKPLYLYYEPTEKYTSGEKYVSGMYFMMGASHWEDKGDVKKELGIEESFYYVNRREDFTSAENLTITETNLAASISNHVYNFFNFEKEATDLYLCYTYTYNPKRAIYDVAAFEGANTSTSVPYTVSKRNPGGNGSVNYVACNTIVSGFLYNTLLINPAGKLGTMFDRHTFIASGNVFCNKYGCIPEHTYAGNRYLGASTTLNDIRYYATNTANNEYVDYGMTKLELPCLGLYVAGYTKGKEPLRLRDVVITENAYTAENSEGALTVDVSAETTLEGTAPEGAFHSVYLLQNPNAEKPFNLAYPDVVFEEDGKVKETYAHSNLFIYLRGAANSKAKYVSSIAVGAYSRDLYKNGTSAKSNDDHLSGIDTVADMTAMAGAVSVSADEVLNKNLAVANSKAWYNRKNKYGYIDDTALEYNSSAYIGVSRTDDPTKAITGALLVQSDKFTTESVIKMDDVVFRCDAIQSPIVINGKKYYLYYTRNTGMFSGAPIEEISIDNIPLVNSSTTALIGNKTGITSLEITGDATLPMFIHMQYDRGQLNHAFFNDVFIGTGKSRKAAMLDLVAQGCGEFVDYDLNDGAEGNTVYFGYRYGSVNQKKIDAAKTEEDKEIVRREELQEAICDVVFTVGEPYQPDGFIGKNRVYYTPASERDLNSRTMGDEIYMYYCCSWTSSDYNERNSAATYDPLNMYQPIKSFAFAPYDCVPYNKDYAESTDDDDLTVYEYVMRNDEQLPADLNSGVVVMNGSYDAEGDNRITMFASRYENDMKPSAEITGGYVGKTTDIGELYLKNQG